TGSAAAAPAASAKAAGSTSRPAWRAARWTTAGWTAEPATAQAGQTRQRVHVVIARHQSPHAVLTAIVGLPRAGRREAAIALQVLIPHDAHHRTRHRLAVLVHDAAGDHAAARQVEFDAFQLLAVAELQGRAGLKRPPLTVRQRHES